MVGRGGSGDARVRLAVGLLLLLVMMIGGDTVPIYAEVQACMNDKTELCG